MKRTLKLLGGIAAVVAIVALAAPASHAQCPAARSFGGFPGGKLGAQVVIDASAFQDNNNELGQFWETGNPGNGSGVGAAGSCDSQGSGTALAWWQNVGTTTLRGIRGFVAQPGCTLALCPGVGASLTFLVEDMTADGSSSGFVMYTVDETPAGARWYDHARTDPNAGIGTSLTHVMGSLPAVFIGGSNGAPPATTASNDYADIGILFHGVTGAGNTPLPGSAQISSYDVMSASNADPGRDRSLWTLVQKVPYNDADILADQVVVPCPGGPVGTTVLAIGLTLDGGIETSTVGPASLPFSCDPNLAVPEEDTPKVRRPSIKRQKPVSRSGR